MSFLVIVENNAFILSSRKCNTNLLFPKSITMTPIHFPFMKVGGKHSCSNFNRKKNATWKEALT